MKFHRNDIGSPIMKYFNDFRSNFFAKISLSLLSGLMMVSCPLSIASNTLAASLDRGLSWQYGPPVEQIIPLGGMVSEIVNTSFFRTRSLS